MSKNILTHMWEPNSGLLVFSVDDQATAPLLLDVTTVHKIKYSREKKVLHTGISAVVSA